MAFELVGADGGEQRVAAAGHIVFDEFGRKRAHCELRAREVAPDGAALFADDDSGLQRMGFSGEADEVALRLRQIARLVERLLAEGEHLVAADHEAGPRLRHAHGFHLGELHGLVAHGYAVCTHSGAIRFFIDVWRNGFGADAGSRQQGAAAGAAGSERDGEAHGWPRRSCRRLRIAAAVSSTERRETSMVFHWLRWNRRLACVISSRTASSSA